MGVQVCGKCQAKFELRLNGVTVVETAGTPPKPFRLWRADSYGCPICHAELITNFSQEPMIESHEEGFEKAMAAIPDGRRRVLYSPTYLLQTVNFETKYVRTYGSN
jgi:hypothetical protein